MHAWKMFLQNALAAIKLFIYWFFPWLMLSGYEGVSELSLFIVHNVPAMSTQTQT